MCAKSSTVKMVAQDRVTEGTVRGWGARCCWAICSPGGGGAAGTGNPSPEQKQRQPSPAQLQKMVHSQNESPAARGPCQDTRSSSLGGLVGEQREWGSDPGLEGLTFLLQHHIQQSDEKNSLSKTWQVKPEHNDLKFRTGNVLQGSSRTHLRQVW